MIEEFNKFVVEMVKVLDEKFEKYQDSWKDTNSGDIRAKLKEQVEDLNNIITSNTEFKKPGYEEKVRRILIHIANYCCFLFNMFMEKKKEKKIISTFKLYNYPDGTEIGMSIIDIEKKAIKLYEKIKRIDVIDKEEIRKFLLEVYMGNNVTSC